MKQLFNINEENAIKLEKIAKLMNKTKTKIINDLIEKNLIIDAVLAQQKIEEIEEELQKLRS